MSSCYACRRAYAALASLALLAVPRVALGDEADAPLARCEGNITKVVVEGNQRTAERVILQAARLAPGVRCSESLLEAARQRVTNLELFSDVDVTSTREPAGESVTIAVEERWTLFPVPFAAASGRGYKAGAFLLERNLFGLNKVIAVGAIQSTQGPRIFAYFDDFGVRQSRWLLRATATYTNLLREQYEGRNRVYAYRDHRFAFRVMPGYELTPELRLYAGWSGATTRTRQRGQFEPPPAGGTRQGPTLGFEIDAADYREYSNAGLVLKSNLETSFEGLASDRSTVHASTALTYSGTAFFDHAASASLAYEVSQGREHVDAILLGGRAGTRGFEMDGLWATAIASSSFEYQVPFAKPRWGTWTIAAFADLGVAQEVNASTLHAYASPGLGIRLFLKRLALPALGVDVAWSVEDHRALTTAAVGVAF